MSQKTTFDKPVGARKKLERHEGMPDNADWVEDSRRELLAYEYLVYCAEAREWLQLCIGEEMPPVGNAMDESLRNGVALAKLSKFFAAEVKEKVFDPEGVEPLKYKHTDNINYFFKATKHVGFPKIFLFTTPDLYDNKALFRIIYCIHALGHYLSMKGLAPPMPNLYGKVDFSEEIMRCAEEYLRSHAGALPNFRNIRNALKKELSPEERARLEEEERRRRLQEEDERRRREKEEQDRYLKEHEKDVINLQARVRGFMARRRFNNRMKLFKDNQDAIVKIQAWWRSVRTGEDYRILMNSENPPLSIVRKFLHLLEHGEQDIRDALRLQELREQIIKRIRENQQYEKAVDALDIKIGLLVKNRISLEEAVAQTSSIFDLFKRKKPVVVEKSELASLKTLNLDSRKKLESYQHLFHLLQTEPRYLARVFLLMNASQLPTFVQSMVLTLFSYAQNTREEYLLLKLFRCSITEELQKADKLEDLITGNLVIYKLVVQYTRRAREREYLTDLLRPLVKEILDESSLDIELDPLALYKRVIREEETSTGQKSTLPYEVAPDQARENPKVQELLAKNLEVLKGLAQKFLEALVGSLSRVPYGIRFMASEMKRAIGERFPTEEHNKVLKIIGNLVYYRYINPSIVAPDAYEVVDGAVSTLQRKNLGEISKILQMATSSSGEAEELGPLAPLREFIQHCHSEMFEFFDKVAQCESPEEHFSISQFGETAEVTKPVIFISPNEIYATHSLLWNHRSDLVSSDKDPLVRFLTELGQPPETSEAGNGLISLSLTSGLEPVEDEKNKVNTLFIQTKALVIPLISCVHGEDLLQVLDTATTAEDEKRYELIQQLNTNKLDPKNTEWLNMTLQQVKAAVRANLEALEKEGLVTLESKYQQMVNEIARDIKNKHNLRRQLKQDIRQTQQAWEKLCQKTFYLNVQVEQYKTYLQTCIERQGSKKKASKKKDQPRFGKKKFTADKLFKKGILVELDGVPENQRGAVKFTFACDEIGVFTVTGKFLAMKVDTVEIKLDDLLQKQFENVNVMPLLDVCKINVNLLIHLLNKEFLVKK